jgi:intracellular septation protein
MQLILEYVPVLAFLLAYKFFGGIYVATTVLVVGMSLSLALLWLKAKKMPTMYFISTALVLVFGAATLLLRDARFIQWKPTILMWLVALAFLVSAFVGKQTLAQRFLQHIIGEADMTRGDWLKLNTAWVFYGLLTGAANLYVAFNYSEATWVNFKFWGLMGIMFVFLMGQFAWLYARGKLK